MLEFITDLTDDELEAVAAGATVRWSGSVAGTGLTKADIVGTTKTTAETTKTNESASVAFEYTVTTA